MIDNIGNHGKALRISEPLCRRDPQFHRWDPDRCDMDVHAGIGFGNDVSHYYA